LKQAKFSPISPLKRGSLADFVLSALPSVLSWRQSNQCKALKKAEVEFKAPPQRRDRYRLAHLNLLFEREARNELAGQTQNDALISGSFCEHL
jgi:hypothetical protein